MEEHDDLDSIIDAIDLPAGYGSPAAETPQEVGVGTSADPAQVGEAAADEGAESGEVATPEDVEADLQARAKVLEERELRIEQRERDRLDSEDAAKLARDRQQAEERERREAGFVRELATKMGEEAPELAKLFVPWARDVQGRLNRAKAESTEQEQAIEAWVYATMQHIDPTQFDEIKDLALQMSGVPRDQMVPFADQVVRDRTSRQKTEVEQQAYVAKIERELAELKGERPLEADAVDMSTTGSGGFGRAYEDMTLDDILDQAARGFG